MKTLIVDGNNTAFQALGKAPLFHEGQRTEVIKIMLTMLRGYLERFQPDAAVIAWDGGRDERRKSIFPEYKCKKKPPTAAEKAERECVFEQMRQLVPIISGLGFEQFKVNYREGDDIIYNILLQEFAPRGERIVISTDQDMFQLLTYFDDVKIFSPIKKLMIDSDWVEQTFDIPITQFAFYKALVGDGSDNIPGIRGIGPKKAIGLIKLLCTRHSEEDKKKAIINVVHSEKELEKQMSLVTLLPISEEEMVEGWIESGPTTDIETTMMAVEEQYGLEQIKEHHDRWWHPFNQYHLRRSAL
jgi:5'-3' exonuclease